MNVKMLVAAVLLLLAARAGAQTPTTYYGQTKQAVTFGGVAQPITGTIGIYNVAGSSVVIRCTDAAGGIISCGGSGGTGGFALVSASIAVTSGAGEVVFASTGTLRQCSTSVPLNSVYDLEIVTNDADAFPVFGRAQISGKAGLIGTRYLFGAYKIKITSATIDGLYKALCVIML